MWADRPSSLALRPYGTAGPRSFAHFPPSLLTDPFPMTSVPPRFFLSMSSSVTVPLGNEDPPQPFPACCSPAFPTSMATMPSAGSHRFLGANQATSPTSASSDVIWEPETSKCCKSQFSRLGSGRWHLPGRRCPKPPAGPRSSPTCQGAATAPAWPELQKTVRRSSSSPVTPHAEARVSHRKTSQIMTNP